VDDRERALVWMNRDYVTRRHASENPGVVDDLADELASARADVVAEMTVRLAGMADGAFYFGKEIDRLRDRINALLVENEALKESLKKMNKERKLLSDLLDQAEPR
jgi:hypothetical protein